MAKTWRTGQFGLTSFDNHDISLSSLIDHFNDNINENFSDIAITADATFGDVAIPSDVTTTDITGVVYTYSDVSIPSDALYSDTDDVSEPTYIDLIKNT
jgi:hypothetical protein